MINGMGEPAAIEAERVKIEKDFGVKAFYNGADMTKPAEIAAMVADAQSQVGFAGHTRQQRRHPVRFADRGFSAGEVGRDHRDQPLRRLPRHARRGARHEGAEMGPHHHRPRRRTRWSPRPFKSAYVSAKHGLAGLTKTVALEVATFGITANCISPGYVWTPLVENQIPDTMKARNLTREQVINDVMLAAQPTKQFVTVRSGRRTGGVSLLRQRRADHRRQSLHRRRLDRSVKTVRGKRLTSARRINLALQGRRVARGVHLGSPGRDPRGRAPRDSGRERGQRGRHERSRACGGTARNDRDGARRKLHEFWHPSAPRDRCPRRSDPCLSSGSAPGKARSRRRDGWTRSRKCRRPTPLIL